MAIEKKFLPEFKFYLGARAPGYSLKRQWFVYYHSPEGRVKIYGNINAFNTYEGRMQALENLIDELTAEYIPPHCIKELLYQKLKSKGYRKKKTIQSFESKLNVLFNFLGKRKVTRENLQLFFDHLHNRHPSTFNAYRVFLKMIFKDARLVHLFPPIRRKKAKRTPARYFQSYHIQRLKYYIREKDAQLFLMIQLMYYCALRPGEIRMIRAGDILFDDYRIYIRGDDAKNVETTYVYIPNQLQEALEFIKVLPSDSYIFPHSKSIFDPCSVNKFATRHQKILKYLGFNTKEYKLYSWRHTAAVRLLKAGWSIKQIQLHYRHSSIEVTDQYLRQLKIGDFDYIREQFPSI